MTKHDQEGRMIAEDDMVQEELMSVSYLDSSFCNGLLVAKHYILENITSKKLSGICSSIYSFKVPFPDGYKLNVAFLTFVAVTVSVLDT
ncbi:Hypothetical predicted protein [Octopus vulgaris]|uniref:Uncharacterized protein n=1 Tax=Octopus vulgaris TaxID=6645 RepID=A0AA36BLG1_OCTVU|nr:Hypothetical predicted protein [Octopus vulgaris]